MAAILKFLTEEEESRLLASCGRQQHAAGDCIVREGERVRQLFILREGEARVERSHGGYTLEISRLGPGDLFGEMGFVEDEGASASVVADGACVVDVIGDDDVLTMMQIDPDFSGNFYRSIAWLLSRRLRATSVQALSEFSWGTGSFSHGDEEPVKDDQAPSWGGGSPLRDS